MALTVGLDVSLKNTSTMVELLSELVYVRFLKLPPVRSNPRPANVSTRRTMMFAAWPGPRE
jgi:hypothetical protein